jgi:lipopolysaccharide biosynthesis protein
MSQTPILRTILFRALRAAFRLTPLTARARDRLRQQFLERLPSIVPEGPKGMAPAGSARGWRDHGAHRFLNYVERSTTAPPSPAPARVVAFYLPQYHPIPENDAWWGAGFTEWSNVSRAMPQFEGHAQPRLPGELGFYDLRLPTVMQQQVELARQYGVSAFCTYFYWFAGKTLLEGPLRTWLETPSIEFPIALCWANENWSRRWDGRSEDVLMGQAHSSDDDLAFIQYISRYLRDPRYLRIGGKPMLLVYRPGLLPDPAATAARWRQWCRSNDIGEIHLAYVQSFDTVDPASIGFDAAVEFPPNSTRLPAVTASHRLINPDYKGEILDWREVALKSMTEEDPPYLLHPGVNPGWDNEARRSGRGRTYVHASPRLFSQWARHAIMTARRRAPDDPLVFVNAWNEWAEGAILEPDTRYGYAWLHAIRRALTPPPPKQSRPCAVIHVWYPEVLPELVAALEGTGLQFRILLTVPTEREVAVRVAVAQLRLDAEVVVVSNRGRDVLPFLRIATQLLDQGEDVVIKLHTKRSAHRTNGAEWRRDLVSRLLAPERAPAILNAFARDHRLGVVAPEGHVQPLAQFAGANKLSIEYLCRIAGLEPPGTDATFVAGSMFWCRLDALSPLFNAPLAEADFEPESGQIDGTLAHAIERLVTFAAEGAGFHNMTAAGVVGDTEPGPQPYEYAARG